MPIRFACPHCQQPLSVPEAKARHEVKCPRCRSVVTAPTEDQPIPPPPPAVEDSDAGQPPISPPFAVDVGGSDLVYAPDDLSAIRIPAGQDLVAVPRRVVFVQGFLLGAIAIMFFIFGVVVGSHSSDQQAAGVPRSCQVRGRITYATATDTPLPDADSVVLVFPVSRRPDPKIPVEGLRPSDRVPDASHPGVSALRDLGGAFARADRNGQFQLQVPDAGRYFILVISHHARRAESEQPKTRDLAQIGRYVLPASEILGRQQYSWREWNLREDRTLDVEF